MIRRHEHDVFPLLRRRYLFSGVENFRLFDFTSHSGYVDENVFAYTNGAGDQRVLILYNNSYNSTAGSIRHSVAINTGPAEEPHLINESLEQALGIRINPGCWILFRDAIRNQEYLLPGAELSERGFSADLRGFEYRVFLNFRRVTDETGMWARLAERLGNNGCDDLNLAYRRLELEPVLGRIRSQTDSEHLLPHQTTLKQLAQAPFVAKLGSGTQKEFQTLLQEIPGGDLLDMIHLRDFLVRLPDLWTDENLFEGEEHPPTPDDENLLVEAFAQELVSGRSEAADWRYIVRMARFLTRSSAEIAALGKGKIDWFPAALNDPEVQKLLGTNRHEGSVWLNREALQQFLRAMAASWLVDGERADPAHLLDGMALILSAAEKGGYRVEQLEKLLSE